MGNDTANTAYAFGTVVMWFFYICAGVTALAGLILGCQGGGILGFVTIIVAAVIAVINVVLGKLASLFLFFMADTLSTLRGISYHVESIKNGTVQGTTTGTQHAPITKSGYAPSSKSGNTDLSKIGTLFKNADEKSDDKSEGIITGHEGLANGMMKNYYD